MVIFDGLLEWRGDPVVEIGVDGKEFYSDKAKYPEVESLGGEREYGAYYVDEIYPP